MLGRPTEAARTAKQALVLLRGYGIHSSVLLSNRIEALLIIGDWDAADTESAAALRSITGSFPYMLLMNRADLEMGRGDFEAARTHLDLARATLREDHGLGVYEVYQAELALWQRRWTDAVRLVDDALARAPGLERAQLRVWFCAKGLRAHAELAALSSASRDARGVRAWRQEADRLLTIAHDAARESAPSPRTPRPGTPSHGPSTSASTTKHGPNRGRTPLNAGTIWSASRRPSTAAGDMPRPWSPPARTAHASRNRCAMRTPRPPDSEHNR